MINKIIKILLLIVVLSFSVGLVSADGNFTDLNNDIQNVVGNELVLSQNYTFNATEDSAFQIGVVINMDNFVLDGNGYTINGDGQAIIFN